MYGIENYTSHGSTVKVFIRGESKGIQDIETGQIYDALVPQPLPCRHMDCCTHIPEPAEFEVDVPLRPGEYKFFRILRES
ncbi:MAG: hypothetical protein KBT01_00290, partial [Clostridiales bacterium]|nr:hypothetical protein [Candidatus Blautia equi]